MKTASQLYDERTIIQHGHFKGATITLSKKAIVELMEKYTTETLRDELIKFQVWCEKTDEMPDDINYCTAVVDKYLKSK